MKRNLAALFVVSLLAMTMSTVLALPPPDPGVCRKHPEHWKCSASTTTTTTAPTTTTTGATTTTTTPTTTTTAATTTTTAPTTTTAATTTTAPTTTTTAPTGCAGLAVAAGANLVTVAANAPAGTTFCLAAGTYSVGSPIVGQTGDRWIGAGARVSIISGNDSTRFFMSCVCTDMVWQNFVVERFHGQVREPSGTDVGVQDGLTGGDLSRLLVENVESRYNWGAGLQVYSGMVVRDSYIHHNHWLGLSGNGANNVLIEGNEIAFNNYLGEHNWGWSAGGMKLVHNSNVTLRSNHSHHNCGPGLWSDNVASGYLYEGNSVHDNHGPGIMHEISDGAIIRNNTAANNAWGDAGGVCSQARIAGGYGGGILIADSHDVEAYGNTLTGNDGGIVLLNNPRGTGEDARNVNVHDNDISIPANTGYRATGCYDGEGGACYTAAYNNRFNGNDYHVNGVANPFQWDGATRSWSYWQAEGFDLTGSLD